jgi:cytochrome c oxidase assembly protein subunit 15
MSERQSGPDVGARRTLGDVLTIAFGVTVVMWGVGFLCRLPVGGGDDPAELIVRSEVLAGLLLLCLLGAGWATGRYTSRGLAGGALVGLLVGLVNLLVIGGLLGEDRATVTRSAAVWIPGTFVVTIVCGVLGAVVGARWRRPAAPLAAWRGRLAAVAAWATLLLIMVGGTVTGFDAGLAVPDWPNTEGTMMFLYPLAKMTGGIYFEHAHRLIGSLVGLVTLVLAIYLHRWEPRAWVRRLGWTALVLVVIQGVLGGLRVTGVFTFSTSADDLRPSLTLAVVHGVFGQVFFSIMVALAAFTSLAWQRGAPPRPALTAGTDRALLKLLYGGLVVQLVVGALVRHLMSSERAVASGWVESLLMVHIALAVIVSLVALGCGLRAWGLYPDLPPLGRLGTTLLALIGLQVLLGVAAYIVVYGGAAEPHQATGFDVLITTLHQTTGAALLGVAVLLMAWSYRRLVPAEAEAASVAAAAPSQAG